MVRELVKRVVAKVAPEEPIIKNCAKWIVCSEDSIEDPWV